jgi:hypothetical protein
VVENKNTSWKAIRNFTPPHKPLRTIMQVILRPHLLCGLKDPNIKRFQYLIQISRIKVIFGVSGLNIFSVVMNGVTD